MTHLPVDDEGVEAMWILAEEGVDLMLQDESGADVVSSPSGLGSTYERRRGGVYRYVAFKATRMDLHTSSSRYPAFGEIYFQLRFGQEWDRTYFDDATTTTRSLAEITDAGGEPAFDSALHCDAEAIIAGVRRWLVGWSTSGEMATLWRP